jgi:hypothetical protein
MGWQFDCVQGKPTAAPRTQGSGEMKGHKYSVTDNPCDNECKKESYKCDVTAALFFIHGTVYLKDKGE